MTVLVGVITAQAEDTVLTTITEVRSLSPSQALQEKEARITGIVVYVESYAIMVQDETGSTFFRPSEEQYQSLKVGDEVEVRGRTEMGRYIAGLGFAEVRVLRRGLPPPTLHVAFDDIAAARYFYQRVAVEGIVRSIKPHHGGMDRSVLRLAIGARILQVRIPKLPQSGRDLIDARVRVTGISAGTLNGQRQVIETFIRMQSWDEIEILDPPVRADAVPLISADKLLTFRPSGRPDRRIAVAGTVTAVFPEGEVYLQEKGIPFAARLDHPEPLTVGERVELVGFAEVFQFAASVVDAEIRRRDRGQVPAPIFLGAPDALNASHHARLVAVEGRVVDAFKSPDGYALVLAGEQRTIQVYVSGDKDIPAVGALVRVAGICHVELSLSVNFMRYAGAIHLRARSPDDVALLESPPWWTPRRLVTVLAVFAGVILVGLVWNLALRRQVRRKTVALRERIESEAALEERQRIAQEFHDTLEQDLTGLGLRLDAAATRTFDENGRQIMAVSRSLLARIQAETKNIVSNLRDPAPLERDLVTALEETVRNSAGLAGLEVELQIGVRPRLLSGGTLHHLHMMARESVNNALKHAQATRITVWVTMAEGQVVLRVSDNGCGLESEAVTRGRSGHFGCIGLRERARKIGATVAWRSEPGHGTTVEIVLPVKAAMADAPNSLRPRISDLTLRN